tara:strand:- start:28 stop:279 length:252 start_codon:yes stop_codon:yes gene_type:complete
LNNEIKNNCVEIKKINGNISNIKVGEFNMDKYIGKKLLTSKSLKKSISLKRFKIKTKLNIIKVTYKKEFKNILLKNLIYVFIF